MESIAVGINGFGTIGRRVANAVQKQPDMELVGVAKRNADATTRKAIERLDTVLHLLDDPRDVESLTRKSDVIVDGTPSGVGEQYAPIYRELTTPAVFQGGEDADVADASFNAYAAADGRVPLDASSYRVVSCNTTGLARILTILDSHVQPVEHVDVTLVRRAGDPGEVTRGPVNDIIPDPVDIPSHHGPDLEAVLPSIDITTTAMKVPATQMHMHSVTVTFAEQAQQTPIMHALADSSRIALVEGEGLNSGGALREFAYEVGRPHGSLYENCVWGDSLHFDGSCVSFMQGIHQRSDTIPETIDAVRLLVSDIDPHESINRTDAALGIGDLFKS